MSDFWRGVDTREKGAARGELLTSYSFYVEGRPKDGGGRGGLNFNTYTN